MFQALKQWFGFTAKKEAKDANSLAVCLRTLVPPPAMSLQDKIIVVCKGAELKLRKEGALPDRLDSGEVCWILPGGDVRLPIEFRYEVQEIRAVVVLRFEGDRSFVLYAANLLASGKEGITEAELAQFVAGQWSELLALQNVTAEQLQKPDVVARFRAHLSLLLQENGFRCTGIEAVTIQLPRTAESAALEMPEAVVQELNEAVKQAASETDWDHLLDQLDEAGFVPHESDIESLESLGNDYRNKKVSADDAALKIRRMIERNNLEIGLITERVARWSATAVKLRLLDSFDKPKEYALAAAKSLGKPEKVPSTWYQLRRHKVDEKLQKYLKNAARTLEGLLETAKNRHSGIENKAELASAQATLKRIADKLTMTPDLCAGDSLRSQQQSRQRGLDELVQAVRRSVTATQLSEGLIRSLVSKEYPKERYLAIINDLESALTTLEREIDDRRNVYGV